MRYGGLQIEVKEKEWFCSLAVRDPSGLISTVVYERGQKLELVLDQLLQNADKEYKDILERYQDSVQTELDLW